MARENWRWGRHRDDPMPPRGTKEREELDRRTAAAEKQARQRRNDAIFMMLVFSALATGDTRYKIKEPEITLSGPSKAGESPGLKALREVRNRMATSRPKIFAEKTSALERCREVEKVLSQSQNKEDFVEVGLYIGKNAGRFSDPALREELLSAMQKNFSVTPEQIAAAPDNARAILHKELATKGGQVAGCNVLVQWYFSWNDEKYSGKYPAQVVRILDELIRQTEAKVEGSERAALAFARIAATLE